MLKMGNSVEVFHLSCEDSGPIDVFSEFWIYHVVTQGMRMVCSETRFNVVNRRYFETGSTSRRNLVNLDAN